MEWQTRSVRLMLVVCGAALVLLLGVFANHPTQAFERYQEGCNAAECHGDFDSGTSPKGTVFPGDDKHRMHRNNTNMNTDCNLCHSTGDNDNPFIGESDGTANNPGLGCTGCHGRDYGGALGSSGVGLREHHQNNGVTFCGACHSSDPAPLPENVLPIYYGTVDTNVDDPCNSGPAFLENWSISDNEGLDNDGDNAYDGADSDCGVQVPMQIMKFTFFPF